MKISINWLKEYIDLPETVSELSDILTFSGIEVEGITELSALQDSIITARVVSEEAVPKSDHLHKCKVDIGDYAGMDRSLLDENGMLDIVCGAPNCRAGIIAVLALPGTVFGDMTIKSAKLRGCVSNGMLCSERELGLSDNHAGIIELPDDTPVGISPNLLFNLPDQIFELEITPNRSDLLSILGIARDLSACLNREMKQPQIPAFQASETRIGLKLELRDPELCPRYTARLFENVRIKSSPLWLKTLLTKLGLRPINNIVDITNYVMLLTGQPLHAFDYELLQRETDQDENPAVIIRRAIEGETILALDGSTYKLDINDLVIADGKKPSAIAGVMGSEYSGVNDNTRHIVLESASFNPASIRRTSYKHKLSTDSSYRFERHLSPLKVSMASDLATGLISELAGPEAIGSLMDKDCSRHEQLILGLRPARFEELIGFCLSDEEIRSYLERLGLNFIQYGTWQEGRITDPSTLHCHHGLEMAAGKTEFSEDIDCVHSHYYQIPPDRIDLEREIDLIEELARLAGYDKVPQKTIPSQIMDRHAYNLRQKVTDYFVSRGCFETLTYSWDDPSLLVKLGYTEDSPQLQMPRIKNPQDSSQAVMRSSLLPSVLGRLLHNLNYGERNIRLFELSKVYRRNNGKNEEQYSLAAVLTGAASSEHWMNKPVALKLFHVKGIVEQLLELLGLNQLSVCDLHEPFYVPDSGFGYESGNSELASFGMLKPDLAEALGIDTLTLKQDLWVVMLDIFKLTEATRNLKVLFKPVSRFPHVIRDISFLLKKEHSYKKLEDTILALNSDIIELVSVFDEYRSDKLPEGFRSVSLHLQLRDQQKTLTEERIEELVDFVIKKLQNDLDIIMR
ncbi:MAG: phenylalanine--tRNA ligase subunit beta [Candidatus Cloacimonadota bacterium]